MHWKKELKKGKQFLAEKDLPKALKCFESAVTNCPVSAPNGLEKSLYFLGITLKKLGRSESALRCWHIGRKLKSNGLSIKMIRRHSNRYGMPFKACSQEDEDKEAFVGIQLERYLNAKKNHRFCTDAERDVIVDIILSYWSDLLIEGEMDHLSIDEKLFFFRNQRIVFPVADITYLDKAHNDALVYTDFQKGKAQSMDDLCPCGSGNIFSQCCGRIKTIEELGSGDF